MAPTTRINNITLLNEFTDLCNLRCVMCDHGRMNTVHGPHPSGIMDEELFTLLLKRIHNSHIHLDCFHAGWLGEPLCHPQFPHLLKRLFGEDAAYMLFDGFSMNTNAVLLNREISDAIIDYSAFMEQAKKGFVRIHLSLHAASEYIYERITGRRGKNINCTLDNIDYLLRRRREKHLRFPNLTLLFVVTKVNQKEAEKFLRFWSSRLNRYERQYEVVYDWPEDSAQNALDAIYFRREDAFEQYEAERLHKCVVYNLGLIPKTRMSERVIRTHAVLRKRADDYLDNARRPCPALWRTLAIHHSGVVVPCCSDVNLELKMGDLKTHSLDEIWNGPEITNLRLAHIRGDFKRYRRCYYCNNIDSFVISDEELVQYLQDINYHREIDPFLERMRSIRVYAPLSQRDFLNVCLVSREYLPETDWGGIGKYNYELAHGLAEQGHNVHVIALSTDGDKEYKDNNIHVHRILHRELFPLKLNFREFAVRLEYSYRLSKKLKEVIDTHHIDIVEAPNFFAEPLVYSFLKKAPLVVRLHSSFSEIIRAYQWPKTLDRRLSCFLEDVSILRSNAITCSTESCARIFAESLGIDIKRIAIVPLGIEIPSLDDTRRENAALLKDRLEVLFVGRLERRKGVQVLMQAIPEVVKEFPRVRFTLIGRDTFVNRRHSSFSGTQEESFKELLLKGFPLECKENITFLDYIQKEDLSFYFKRCDVFVAPSLYETFGLVYLEAMSYGKPVIGCRVGGVPEVVVDQETGVLLPPGDSSALAKAIISLLSDKKRAEEMGRAARSHVETNFSRELMVENTVNVYRKVLNGKMQ